MLWFVLSLLTALTVSMRDVVSKKTVGKIDEYVAAWSLRFFAFLFLLPLLFFIEIPPIGEQFWLALLVGGSLNVITTILYMKALKHSDLSITIPLMSFTPLFILITSPLLIGEYPNFPGLIGILLIVGGAYTLNFKEKHKGYLAPFRALIKEPGPKFMLITAFIWSITSNIDKIGLENSSPIFWAITANLFISLGILPIMLYKSREKSKVRSNLKALIPIGFIVAVMWFFQMTAISMTNVAYVIAIKRTGVLMSVFFGYLIFKEKGIRERLLGALLMVLGVALIALS